jgi:hypothetical protein
LKIIIKNYCHYLNLFNKSELKLKNNQTAWKDAYTLEKDNSKKVYTNLILQTNIR